MLFHVEKNKKKVFGQNKEKFSNYLIKDHDYDKFNAAALIERAV